MAGPAYLHGIETLTVTKGIRPITVINSSVIGLVGISYKGTSQSLISCLSPTDDAQFGVEIPGCSIPQALAAIRAQQASTVLVVNVFVEATHTTAVTAEALVISSALTGKLAFPPVQAGQGATVVIKDSTNTTAVTWVYGTDYTIDDYGNFVGLTSNVTAGTYAATYKKMNAGAVTSSHILGAVTSGVRTGMKMFEEAYATYGYKPKIIITPGYSSLDAVRVGIEAEVDKYKAIGLIDAPASTSVANAITGRGPSGAINFNTANKRSYLLYPMVKAYDTYTNASQNRPYSQFMAGVISSVDFNEGYHVSPSNHLIKGITGMERVITFDPGDNTGLTDANQLNKVGITTIANSFGTGFLTWGNRNASFPANTTPDTFVSVLRTKDVIEDSIQYNMLPFVDKPVELPQIDSVVQSVNNFINTLIGRDALVDGKCYFDVTQNSTAGLAAGQVIFSLDIMPPTPMERMTFLVAIDITLLKSIIKTAA